MTLKEKFIEVFGMEPNWSYGICPFKSSCNKCNYRKDCTANHDYKLENMEYIEPTKELLTNGTKIKE